LLGKNYCKKLLAYFFMTVYFVTLLRKIKNQSRPNVPKKRSWTKFGRPNLKIFRKKKIHRRKNLEKN